MKVGSKVRVHHGEESVVGVVELCSDNGRSLALKIDGLLDGHVGFMALSRNSDGTYHTIISHHVVDVEEIDG